MGSGAQRRDCWRGSQDNPNTVTGNEIETTVQTRGGSALDERKQGHHPQGLALSMKWNAGASAKMELLMREDTMKCDLEELQNYNSR